MKHGHAGLWRVIYIAHGDKQAQQIVDLLCEAGFMPDRRQPSSDAAGEDIEIRALDSEAEEARLFLLERGF